MLKSKGHCNHPGEFLWQSHFRVGSWTTLELEFHWVDSEHTYRTRFHSYYYLYSNSDYKKLRGNCQSREQLSLICFRSSILKTPQRSFLQKFLFWQPRIDKDWGQTGALLTQVAFWNLWDFSDWVTPIYPVMPFLATVFFGYFLPVEREWNGVGQHTSHNMLSCDSLHI